MLRFFSGCNDDSYHQGLWLQLRRMTGRCYQPGSRGGLGLIVNDNVTVYKKNNSKVSAAKIQKVCYTSLIADIVFFFRIRRYLCLLLCDVALTNLLL